MWAFQQQGGAEANSRGAEGGSSSAALNPNNGHDLYDYVRCSLALMATQEAYN